MGNETHELRLGLLSRDPGFLESWAPLAEFTFLLIAAGLVCTAVGLAGHAVAWSVPSGVALLAGAGFLLAQTGVSGASAALLGLTCVCVSLEVLVLTGLGLHAAAAATSLLLAGLGLSGAPQVHPGLAVPASVGLGIGVFAAAFTSWRRRREQPFDTTARLAGRGAVVMRAATATPVAVIAGEIWELEAEHTELEDGQFVRVVEALDNRLLVRVATPPGPT